MKLEKYFPFFHWAATLVLAPLIDALLSSDHSLLRSVDNFLVILVSAVVTAFPSLVVYMIIYRVTRKSFQSRWQFKLFLVIIAGLLMLVSLELFDTQTRRDHSLSYAIAIVVSSAFIPVSSPKPVASRQSSVASQQPEPVD